MRLLKTCGSILFLAAVFYSAAQADTFQGFINGDDINVRSDSTPNAEVVCVLSKGTPVTVIKEQYDWCKIRLPKSAPSYVKKTLLECLPEDSPKPSQTPVPLNQRVCHSAKVVGDNVNIRLKPSEGSRILGRLNKNEIVSVLGEESGWFKVEPVENSYAWVYKKFIGKELVKAAPEKVIKPEQGVPLAKEEIQVAEQVTIEGIVMPYGKIFNRVATHKLIAQDKRIFLLKGNKLGLDALNYRKVKISGKILGKMKEKYPVIEIVSMEALS